MINRSILIIDDTTRLADIIVRKLEREHYTARAVRSISEALDDLRVHESPTFILADRVLTNDPIEVRDLERLCQVAPTSKILVYTSQPLSDEQRSKIIERGAFRVLDKNAVEQIVNDIKVLTQELEELLELSNELEAATSERSKIMAALIGNDVTVSMVDRSFHRWFRNSAQVHSGREVCRAHCWIASFGQEMTSSKCWGCPVADVFRDQAPADGLLFNRFPDGSAKWVAVRSTPVSSRSSSSIIAVCEAVTEVSDTALEGLPLDQRLHHIAQSLIRAGFGRVRIYKAISENELRLVAAAARSDSPRSLKSEYFGSIKDLPVDLNDSSHAQTAKKEWIGNLIEKWNGQGPSRAAKILQLQPPYFDVPVWRDQNSLEGWLAIDFIGMPEELRSKAIAKLANKETLAWLQKEYAREIKRAFETNGKKPVHRHKFEISQRARLGIAAARSVDEAIKEIRGAFEQLLPHCCVTVRERTVDALKEFKSLCWGERSGVPENISLSNQQSLAVTVVKSHIPMWISNYQEYIQTAKVSGEPIGYPPENTLSTAQIPLRFESTVFGTLSVSSPTPIDWDKEGYKEPLQALADDTALVLRDLVLHKELDEAMADRAAIIAYSVSVSADGLWRHWAQQRLAEASAIIARVQKRIPSGEAQFDEAIKLLYELSTVITRVNTARPLEEAAPECALTDVYCHLQEIYANRQPLPSFKYTDSFSHLKIPQFILSNIITILLDNALRAIQDSGRGKLICIEAAKREDFLEIRVTDDGPGIPAQEREKILREPLQSKKGQGLGLLYARGAALQYGGDLTFQTSEAGTCFVIRLPLSKQ